MARGDTKARILDATVRLVARNGFDATPVTAIEVEAGLIPGNGSFYRHFPSKRAALAAAVDREITRIRSEAGVDANRDGGDDLASALRRDLDLLARMRALIAILARDRDTVPDIVATIRRTFLDAGLEGYAELSGGPVGVVVLSALVGYHLSTEYFGAVPGGIGPDEFAAALADLVRQRPC